MDQTAVKHRLDGDAEPPEQPERGVVLGQDVAVQLREPTGMRQRHQLAAESSAEALALVVVADKEGHLATVAAGVVHQLGHSDDGGKRTIRHAGDQGDGPLGGLARRRPSAQACGSGLA